MMNSDLYNLIYSTKDRSHFIKVSNSIIKSPSDHILEVGAGTGLSSEILYQLSPNLTLVEPNLNYFEFLGNLFRDKPSVSIHNSFVSDTPLKQYDCIFSIFNVINHISSDELMDFFYSLRQRSSENTKFYFDCYNGDIASSLSFESYEKRIGTNLFLDVEVDRISNEKIILKYSVNNELVDSMVLYIHTSIQINTALKLAGWSFRSSKINGRFGDPLFLEYFCNA